jgi:AcrR family transcriptional regulator
MSQPSPRAKGKRAGLRERKKLKTRLAIQEHALRLFQEQGYTKTTVEQIADAAEVSPSTFFRYFPTKEDVVLFDALDPWFLEAYRRQPAGLTPIQAMRRVLPEVFGAMSPEQIAEQRVRGRLVIEEPALQSAWIADLVRTAGMMASLVAERTGVPVDDKRLQTYTGAVMGAMMGAMIPVLGDPDVDFVAAIDDALGMLEDGLQL